MKILETLALRKFGLFKIPLLFFISPSVMELTHESVVVKIPLNRRTRNHLGSMYFGVLAAGADCAGGLVAMNLIQKSGKKMSMVFKDFEAHFLKRAEGDVHFTCRDGAAIRAMIEEAKTSGDRHNLRSGSPPPFLPSLPTNRWPNSCSLCRLRPSN